MYINLQFIYKLKEEICSGMYAYHTYEVKNKNTYEPGNVEEDLPLNL